MKSKPKKESKKLARRFKDGEWVWDSYIGKKYRYKHDRDKLAGFRLERYVDQDKQPQ